MPDLADITIHRSQWPKSLAVQLGDSLRARCLDSKFHYETPRQVRQWLRLHEALSPALRDSDARLAYDAAFARAVATRKDTPVQVVGLGCGGGQKEAALLSLLAASGAQVRYTATDVSVGMVLTALETAWPHVPHVRCGALVCDLKLANDLAEFFNTRTQPDARRVVTFFGMLPNLDAEQVRRILRQVLRPGDLLLCSANLAPGSDYRRGVELILPQYDNSLTRDWLSLLLHDLGAEPEDGTITSGIEECPSANGLLRVAADWHCQRECRLWAETEAFEFKRGETLRLFFSVRHTPETVGELFAPLSLTCRGSWFGASGEEGVFLFGCE